MTTSNDDHDLRIDPVLSRAMRQHERVTAVTLWLQQRWIQVDDHQAFLHEPRPITASNALNAGQLATTSTGPGGCASMAFISAPDGSRGGAFSQRAC